MKLTVGVTGHRDLVPSEEPLIRDAVREFLTGLQQQFPALDVELVSGLAAGADLLVAEVALELGCEHVAVLPFPQTEYERDFGTEQELSRFRHVLTRSEVIELPPVGGATAEELAAGGAARDRQYAQLGVFISNHCHVLLALWDGREQGPPGGTASVVRYHLTAVMSGLAVAEESPNLLADNENDLAFHLVCSRSGEPGEPQVPYRPLERYWLTALHGRQGGEQLPADYAHMLARLEDFDRDLERHTPELEARARGLLEEAPDLPRPKGVGYVDRLYACADSLAVHYQRRFSVGLFTGHLLAVLMGLVFILYSEFVEQTWLVFLFLALFVSGILYHIIGERREWHRKYLDYRALAEGLRVQVYWNLSGVVDTRSAEFAYDNFLQKQDVDLAWIRHVMRSASLRRDRNEAPDPRWVSWVIDQWIGGEDGTTGQLSYYAAKSSQREARYELTLRLGNLALWSGILMAVLLGLFAPRMGDTQLLVVMILMGVLPLIAGVRDAYSHKKADKELIRQYQFMKRIFHNARRLLDGSDDIAFRRRVLRAVGTAALEEHAEWLLMHRERPLEHGGL